MRLDTQFPVTIQNWLHRLDVQSTHSVSGGGLSGAGIWRCNSSGDAVYCLRQWPTPHPSAERLGFIHTAMQFAREQGLAFVPGLMRNENATFILAEGKFWEVTEWMRGASHYLAEPNQTKLWSAIESLAALHRTLFFLEHHVAAGSPAVAQRIELLERWLSKEQVDGGKYERSLRDANELALVQPTLAALQYHGPKLLVELRRIQVAEVMLQPVLRDIWSDHVLYVEDQVTGIIDYGAMKVDEPATDLARLLGSLEPFDAVLREKAVARYNELLAPTGAPIPAATAPSVDWQRVNMLDRSGSLLTALQWLQWLVVERRKFSVAIELLQKRWQLALARLDLAI